MSKNLSLDKNSLVGCDETACSNNVTPETILVVISQSQPFAMASLLPVESFILESISTPVCFKIYSTSPICPFIKLMANGVIFQSFGSFGGHPASISNLRQKYQP